MARYTTKELLAWQKFTEALLAQGFVPSALPLSDPLSFVAYSFETDKPEYSILHSPTGEKLVMDRRAWATRFHPTKGKKLEKLLGYQAQVHALNRQFGAWGRPSRWKTWRSFFTALGRDKTYRSFSGPASPFKALACQLEALDPPNPPKGHLDPDHYLSGYAQNLREVTCIPDLVEPICLDQIGNPQLDVGKRWRALHQFKRVQLPMIILGRFSSCLNSEGWQRSSRLACAFPFETMFEDAAKHFREGMFWQHWLQWAFRQSGASSRRKWAAMINHRPAGDEEQVTVNLIQRWLRGQTKRPSRISLEAVFKGWGDSVRLNRVDYRHALIEWRLIYLTALNLEITAWQWQRRDDLHQVDIRRAFGLARRAHAYFVQFPSEGTEA